MGTIFVLPLPSLHPQASRWPHYNQQAHPSLRSPTALPTPAAPAHNQQRGHSLRTWLWEPGGYCIAGPYGTETIGERVTGRFPPPRASHPSSREKGLFTCPEGQLQVGHASRGRVAALGERGSGVSILALALGLSAAPWYLPERSLGTHPEIQLLQLSPGDTSGGHAPVGP